jgi:hypothetical protein
MATYQLPDGTTVSDDMAFTWNEIQYPDNWIKLSTKKDRDAIGLKGPLPEEPWYDQQFYLGFDSKGNLIPKDHGTLVTLYSEYCRMNANAMLRETDWMVIREVDNGTAVPDSTKEYRQAIRTAVGVKIEAIEATTTTAELATYSASTEYTTWPSEANTAEGSQG